MSINPPKYDSAIQVVHSPWQNSKSRRSELIVELSRTQPPPLFPIELQDCVSPDKWENRVRAIIRTASRYSKPMLERYWMFLSLILTFITPLVAYYVALAHFNVNQQGEYRQEADQQDELIWESRLIAFGVALGVWFIMFLPVAIWKYIGHVRVNGIVDGWAKDDVRTASSYATIPTWRVNMPGIFRDGVVLIVSYPAALSTFDPESYLPPYIAAPPEAAPSYEAAKRLSSLQGFGRFGEIPLYDYKKEAAV